MTATLLGLVAAGLGLLAVLPAPASSSGQVALAAVAPTPVAVTPLAGADSVRPERQLREESRASRSRRGSLPRPEAVAPVPAPAAPPPPVPVLPGCEGSGSTGGFANGRLPSAVLCELPDGSGERLRADAARSFVRLAAAYDQALGGPVCVVDGYRPLGEQQSLRLTKPRYAARPGFSEHGWGLAVDLGCGMLSSSSPQHLWMQAHAGEYGWVHPEWARRGGSRPEPWHWEYVGAR